jgi:hypothetical protein
MEIGAMPDNLLPWLLMLALLAVGLLGGLAARRLWPPTQRPAPYADPASAAMSFFPTLIAVALYALLGPIALALCLLLFTPLVQGPDYLYSALGCAIGVGGAALLYFGFTLWGDGRRQRLRRREQTPLGDRAGGVS